MFGLKYVRFKLVEFECSPVPEGKMFVAVGLFIAVLTAMGAIVNSGMPLFLPVTLGLVSVGCIGFGVYYWAFRYGPVKRQVVIGNWCHRLYLRNKPLFVLFTGGVYALVVVGVTLVFDLIEWAVEGFDAAVWADRFRLRNLMIVALAFVGGALKYYLDYYYYSRWLKNNG